MENKYKVIRLISLTFILSSLIFLIVSDQAISQEGPKFRLIKDPKPNIVEKSMIPLKKVKTISPDLGGGNFIYFPTSLVIDNNNNIYIYDKFSSKVYKLSPDFKLLSSFGRKGEGPGEIKGSYGNINIGRDGKLYLNDLNGYKIIVFDTEGKYIKEIKVSRLWYPKVVVDEEGNFYSYSTEKGVVDRYDNDFQYVATYLERKEYYYYLFKLPTPEERRLLYLSSFWILPYLDLTPEGQLIVYLKNSSKLFVLNGDKIITERYLFPRKILKLAKERLKRIPKSLGLFHGLIIDEDSRNEFFLIFSSKKQKSPKIFLYKFETTGKLLTVYYIEQKESIPSLLYKKNNIFYCSEEGDITLYKEYKEAGNG